MSVDMAIFALSFSTFCRIIALGKNNNYNGKNNHYKEYKLTERRDDLYSIIQTEISTQTTYNDKFLKV